MSHFTVGVVIQKDADIESAVENLLAPFDENKEVTPYKRYLDEAEVNSMRSFYSVGNFVNDLSKEEVDSLLQEIGIEITNEHLKQHSGNILKNCSMLSRSVYIDDAGQLSYKDYATGHTHVYSETEIVEMTEAAKPIVLQYYLEYSDTEMVFMKEHGGTVLTDKQLVDYMDDWQGSEGEIDEDGIFYWSTYNEEAQWDWYQIGGRWSGMLANINPEDNPQNYEVCVLCQGTGIRNDEVGLGLRKENPEFTCNGCDGKGKSLKWHTQWVDSGGNIASVSEVLRQMEKDSLFFALVTPDGKWHEKGSMGWWAMVSYGDERAPNFESYPDTEEGKNQYREDMRKFEGIINEEWREKEKQLLSEYADDYNVVVVDCHI